MKHHEGRRRERGVVLASAPGVGTLMFIGVGRALAAPRGITLRRASLTSFGAHSPCEPFVGPVASGYQRYGLVGTWQREIQRTSEWAGAFGRWMVVFDWASGYGARDALFLLLKECQPASCFGDWPELILPVLFLVFLADAPGGARQVFGKIQRWSHLFWFSLRALSPLVTAFVARWKQFRSGALSGACGGRFSSGSEDALPEGALIKRFSMLFGPDLVERALQVDQVDEALLLFLEGVGRDLWSDARVWTIAGEQARFPHYDLLLRGLLLLGLWVAPGPDTWVPKQSNSYTGDELLRLWMFWQHFRSPESRLSRAADEIRRGEGA